MASLPSLPAHQRLLRKGLEEEVYTGTRDGEVIGLSHRIAAELPGFATEPDARNVEYTTAPFRDYEVLIGQLMTQRCNLRRYLDDLDLTLVPGGTLSLARDDEFHLSNESNPYYLLIRDTYGTRVVTASTHINIGIEDAEDLIRAYRVLRCDAALYLALTAASPFLHGELTGFHSTRWHLFPETPADVPFFESHPHFVDWVEGRLASGEMHNPRHLWLAIRPNGPASPHELTRLELRVCDRISTPQAIGGVTALYEAEVWRVLEDPGLDPLSSHSDQELRRLVHSNEAAVAQSGLEAEIVEWQSGRSMTAADLVRRRIGGALPIAETHGFAAHFEPLEEILREGNPAQRWIAACREGKTPREILTEEIRLLEETDHQFEPACPTAP